MTTYAIGDVQGDFDLLQQLLNKIGFNPKTDTLWFSGNLVSNHLDSLLVLRFVKSLKNSAIVVLGQQELRLLAKAAGVAAFTAVSEFDDIISAPDWHNLMRWLKSQPFLHHADNFTLVNSGIPPEWTLSQAQTLAVEAETSLSMGNHKVFLENIFGDDPGRWHAKHRGWKRVRFIVNAFTRMHYCSVNSRFHFSSASLEGRADDYYAWFELENRAMFGQAILFGGSVISDKALSDGLYPLDRLENRLAKLSALNISSLPPIYYSI